MAAAGIKAQGIKVPPPTQIAATWPRAVNTAVPPDREWEKILAIDPAREMPENPEPSRPVMAPMTVIVTAPISFVKGTREAREAPRSLTMPLDV